MAERTVTIRITGTAKQLEDALRGAAVVTDEETKAMGDHAEVASGRIGGAFQRLASVMTANGVPFSESIAKIGEKFDEAETKGQKFGQALTTLGGVTLAAGGAAFVAVGAEALEMADKFEPAQSSLQAAVDATGQHFDAWREKIDAAGQRMAALGFNQIQVDQALAQGVVSTQSVSKSLNLLGLAADLARAKHISLTDAMSALSKVMAGSNRALTQLGINLDVGSGKLSSLRTASQAVQKAQMTLTQTQEKVASGQLKGLAASQALANAHYALGIAEQKLHIDQDTVGKSLDALTKRLGGQASDYAKTFTGRMAAMRAELQNTGIKIGEKLIPVLQNMLSLVAKAIGYFERHKTAAIVLAAAVGGPLVVAIGAATAAFITANAATLGIGLALGAVAAGATYLATHWKQVWADIKHWADDAWHFLDGVIHNKIVEVILAPIAPILLLAEHWKTLWQIVQDAIHTAWTVIKPVFDLIKTAGLDEIRIAVTVLQGIWDTAWAVVHGAVTTAWSIMKVPFGFIKTLGTDVIDTAINTLKTDWHLAWDAMQTAVNIAWSAMQKTFGLITHAINDIKGAWDFLFGGGGGGSSGPKTPPIASLPSGPNTAAGQFLPHGIIGGAAAGANLITPGALPLASTASNATTVNLTVNVTGAMMDPQGAARAMQSALLQYGRIVPLPLQGLA